MKSATMKKVDNRRQTGNGEGKQYQFNEADELETRKAQ